ncbi:MAG: N-acetyltransferase family protein [Halothece sp.]
MRQAQTKDLGEVAELLTRSFHSCQGWGMLMYPFLKLGIYEDIRSRLCSDRAYYACLVATASGGKIVGTVELALSSPEGWVPKQYQSTYISNLAVSHGYRRRGIAQRLLHSCEQLTVQWGFQNIYLHVLDNNQQAKKLYEQSGYRLCREEPNLMAWFFNQPKRLLLGKSVISI